MLIETGIAQIYYRMLPLALDFPNGKKQEMIFCLQQVQIIMRIYADGHDRSIMIPLIITIIH